MERDSEGRIQMTALPPPDLGADYARKLAELNALIAETRSRAWARACRDVAVAIMKKFDATRDPLDPLVTRKATRQITR